MSDLDDDEDFVPDTSDESLDEVDSDDAFAGKYTFVFVTI